MEKGKAWLKGLINEEGIVMDMHLLGRLDEQYWKNENIKINKGRLFYLIDQLDEPQKPVIPQKVADFIEKYKGKSHSLAYAINRTEVIKWFNEKHRDEWLYSNERENLFARAWLDGYEVEKEKLYIIKFAPSIYGTPTYGSIGMQNGKKIMQSVYGSQEGIIPNQYTRREIEEVGSEYMIFAEEVME